MSCTVCGLSVLSDSRNLAVYPHSSDPIGIFILCEQVVRVAWTNSVCPCLYRWLIFSDRLVSFDQKDRIFPAEQRSSIVLNITSGNRFAINSMGTGLLKQTT